MTRFITIASGNGGVGKTTVAINLGKALADFGRDVIVVDANVSKPNIGIHLGGSVIVTSLHDVIKRDKNIKDSVYLHQSGLKVIPGNISLDALENLEIEKMPEIIHELEGLTEVVIIDAAPGLHHEAIQALRSGEEVIIVTTPDLPAITDALKTIKAAKRLDLKVLGVIVNRAHGDANDIPLKNIRALLEHDILEVIPEDPDMRRALKLNHPITYTHPDNESSIKFKKVAARLIGTTYIGGKHDSKVEGFLRKVGIKE